MGRTVLIIILVLSVACTEIGDSQQAVSEQCDGPRLGSAFFPGVVISQDPGAFVQSYNTYSDLMLLHFGDKVPWQALECDSVEDCTSADFVEVMDQLALHASKFDGPVYVAVSALNNERNGVATDWDGNKVFANFTDPRVHELYGRWVAYVKQKFRPDYFSQGVEVNMYAEENPVDFDNLIRLMEDTKQGAIGPTIQWEFYKQQWSNGSSMTLEGLGSGFAFSTYPKILDVPEGYDFREYGLEVGGKPVIISETGIGDGLQEAHLERLLALDATHDLKGIVWFFLEDDNQLLTQLPDQYPYTVFKDAGLKDGDGLDFWKARVCQRRGV